MATQTSLDLVRPTWSMTPRAQMAKVILGVTLAVTLAAGPAIAWDMTTQVPSQAAASAAVPKHGRSPWKRAGHDLKDAIKTIARVYLPATGRSPDVKQLPTPAPTASIASVVPLVRPAPTPPPIPTLEIE